MVIDSVFKSFSLFRSFGIFEVIYCDFCVYVYCMIESFLGASRPSFFFGACYGYDRVTWMFVYVMYGTRRSNSVKTELYNSGVEVLDFASIVILLSEFISVQSDGVLSNSSHLHEAAESGCKMWS